MKKTITVNTTSVYEARSLAELVGVANGFSSTIILVMEEKRINAKSIMGVMGIGIDNGSVVTIEAEGQDAEAAIRAIEDFLTR